MTDDPFFHLPQVNQAIEVLASAPSLTIFAGAGVAKDRGSPDWQRLVQSLLEIELKRSRDPGQRELAIEIAKIISESHSPVMAASIVRELAGEEEPKRKRPRINIREALYDESSPGGTLAQGIAWMATVLRAFGHDIAVITTNYDTYIETALSGDELSPADGSIADRLPMVRGIELRPYHGEADPDIGEMVVPVFHLHGFAPDDGSDVKQAVFSERDYAVIRGGWQEQLLVGRLATGAALFVGTSLTDPYLSYCFNEALAQGGTGQDWYALLPLEGERWWQLARPALKAGPLQRETLCRVAGSRLSHHGITALYADFYSQVSQFCFEVLNCGAQGEGSYNSEGSPHRYGQRLLAWWTSWYPDGPEELREHQLANQVVLHNLKHELVDALRGRHDELYKIELWVRHRPEERQLKLWSSSEMALLVEDSIHSAPIAPDSDYLAVRAFAEGRCIGPEPLPDLRTGRWKSYLSVPIWLDGSPWLHLPVGTIAIMATRPDEDLRSALDIVNDQDLERIAKRLQSVGADLLTPS